METRKRNRGAKSREVLASITPEQHARTFKQMAIAARIADALAAKGWSKSEFASRMNQLPSVVTRWLSGTQNFTIDTLSDIEEMLGVQLLVTAVNYAADHPKAGMPVAGVQEGYWPATLHSQDGRKPVVEHHYVPMFYNAEPVMDSCHWTETSGTVKYCLVVNPDPSLN